jgi:predicted TIM-barrel fold metal-dependent hydrolase
LIKPIDIWVNVMTEEQAEKYINYPEMSGSLDPDKRGAGKPPVQQFWTTPEQVVNVMDEAGVEISFIASLYTGRSRRMKPGDLDRLMGDRSYKDLFPYLDKYPDRFRGLYAINPWTMMDGLKEMEVSVKEHGFVGAISHLAGFPAFDDKVWFPFYAKCVELDIPIISQIGHFVHPMSEAAARPYLIDEVAEFFPELRIVAGHTGWPWCEELIAIALKHHNVYVGMEAHLPKYWDPSITKYVDSRGRDKCLWGSDFPVTIPKQNLQQVEELGLREETKPKFLRNNTIKVFKLDLPLA